LKLQPLYWRPRECFGKHERTTNGKSTCGRQYNGCNFKGTVYPNG
jgi:hypothetical protein